MLILPVSHRQVGTSLYHAAFKNNIYIIAIFLLSNKDNLMTFISDGGRHFPTPFATMCSSLYLKTPLLDLGRADSRYLFIVLDVAEGIFYSLCNQR